VRRRRTGSAHQTQALAGIAQSAWSAERPVAFAHWATSDHMITIYTLDHSHSPWAITPIRSAIASASFDVVGLFKNDGDATAFRSATIPHIAAQARRRHGRGFHQEQGRGLWRPMLAIKGRADYTTDKKHGSDLSFLSQQRSLPRSFKFRSNQSLGLQTTARETQTVLIDFSKGFKVDLLRTKRTYERAQRYLR